MVLLAIQTEAIKPRSCSYGHAGLRSSTCECLDIRQRFWNLIIAHLIRKIVSNSVRSVRISLILRARYDQEILRSDGQVSGSILMNSRPTTVGRQGSRGTESKEC